MTRLRGRRAGAVVAAAAAAAGLVAVAGGPAMAQGAATMQANADVVAPGAVFTVTGTGCVRDGVGPGTVSADLGPVGPGQGRWYKDAAADGTWTIEANVSVDQREGDYVLRAHCTLNAPDLGFTYETTIPVEVRVGAPAPGGEPEATPAPDPGPVPGDPEPGEPEPGPEDEAPEMASDGTTPPRSAGGGADAGVDAGDDRDGRSVQPVRATPRYTG